MPIKPKPFKAKCPKCDYTKKVSPKSDVLTVTDSICPKCNTLMKRQEKKEESFFTKLFGG